jgi:glutamate N-acetyltransferase/amino-acid N-acetyltransferase
MCAETARALDCDAEQVLVASTGVIGVALDPRVVSNGIIRAAGRLARDGHSDAAHAIMTTDPFPKESAVRVTLPAGTFHIGGMAKGSGMIEPMLATMLAFLTTDAAVAAHLLQRALADACDDTFNAITVDGECSTNDSVFALASGASGVTIDEASYEAFVEAMREVCLDLALGIVRGGEGATKLVTVRVSGAASYADARRAAKAIGNSPLVKTAVHGGDPNWGRLVAVAGRSGAAFDLSHAAVTVGPVVLFSDGRPFDERAADAAAHLRGTDIHLAVDLGTGGDFEATVFTCDLSAEYVRINAEYRT